ncbi:MAG: ATP-binding protein [Anaerolineae bacterium]|nr:ATP-binding protein [Anaerolineae bacterium]
MNKLKNPANDAQITLSDPTSANPNAYTDAPKLHPNPLVGSLQLLFWIFFHPSAWGSHIARIDPTLRSDFTLAELSRSQWRNPALHWLLIQKLAVWPLAVGVLVGLLLSRSGSLDVMLGGTTYIVTISVVFSLVVGSLVGVVTGVIGGVALGLAFGIIGSLTGIMSTGFAVGTAIGLAGSISVVLARQKSAYSLTLQIGGAIGGVLIASIIVLGLGRVTDFVFIDPAKGVTIDLLFDALANIAGGAVVGVLVGWSRGESFSRVTGGMVGGIAGLVASLLYAVALAIAPKTGIAAGIIIGVLLSISFAISYTLAKQIAGPWAGAVAGALGSAGTYQLTYLRSEPFWLFLPILLGVLLGLTQMWWRPILLYPFIVTWNFFIYRADKLRANSIPSLLRRHSAFWDEYQYLPLFGLEEHVLLAIERNPVEGQAALHYLTNHRHQRWAAQAVQIELDARRLESCADVKAISEAHRSLAAGELTGPASALLRSFSRHSQDVEAALRQESRYNQRLALSAVEDRLDSLLRELTRSSEPYAERFRPIATSWRQTVAGYIQELAEAVEARQEIDSPYIIGVPLTEQQEIFVGRTDVTAQIEQLLLDRRRPPLLLYGQRRMGKTSLLNNLGRLLPSTIVPLFVDLQGASRADDHGGLLYSIARNIVKSAELRRNLTLPTLSWEMLGKNPFLSFDDWLDQVEKALDDQGQYTALLALDEFETLDHAITKGQFDEEKVLGTLRNLIQHRSRFKMLLAGSHTLEELQRWASYLINVQVIHLGCLHETEARQLIERPVDDFALRYEPDAGQRVMTLTRGHPFLVQLLCAEIVALKNEQSPAVRRLACLSDVEAAIPEALSSGSFFFADIQRNQIDPTGLAVLRCLAAQGEGAVVDQTTLTDRIQANPDTVDCALELLTQRELIEPVESGYRFQVELIRRWFI